MKDEPLRSIHVGTGGRGTWPIDVVTADPNWEPVALVEMRLPSKAHVRKQDWENLLVSQASKRQPKWSMRMLH